MVHCNTNSPPKKRLQTILPDHTVNQLSRLAQDTGLPVRTILTRLIDQAARGDNPPINWLIPAQGIDG